MKRHTNKNIKILGSGIAVLAMVALLGSFAVPTWAKTSSTSEADVEFTFSPSITVEMGNKGKTNFEDIGPGQAKEEEGGFDVKVGTNSASGFYLSATAGTSEKGTSLKSETSSDEIKHLLTTDSKENVDALDKNTWGIMVTGAKAQGLPDGYFGLPQEIGGNDLGKQAAAGTKLMDTANSTGEESVNVKVGVKLGTLQPGTYTGQVNFYAVTK